MALKELLWKMVYQSRSLRNFQGILLHVWDDQASRDVGARYLDPHLDADDRMLASLHEQDASLDAAAQSLHAAHLHGIDAERAAAKVQDELTYAERDMHSSLDMYDDARQYCAQAQERLPRVQRLIEAANNACG